MIVYKSVDQYDRNTGEKLAAKRVYDYVICDFTGEKIDLTSCNPDSYSIDHRDNDPNFGDGEGERWLYDYEESVESDFPDGVDSYDFFGGGGDYMFQVKDDYYTEVFQELIETALKEMDDGINSLSHLLRWSRGRMLERVIKSGEYTIQDFMKEGYEY